MAEINWNTLKTAHGNGSHLPDVIALLNSPDEEQRRKANWSIDNFVVLQGSLYEAAYYVIEPIIRLLEQDYTVDRFYPLTILAEIALGWGDGSEIVLQDTGEKTIIDDACQRKLKELLPRIEQIVVVTTKEMTEKETILETINREA